MNEQTANLDKLILQVKRLAFANQSMLTVIDGCAKAFKSNSDESDRMIISAGIAILYASPFTEGNGLGALENQFSEFDDKLLDDYHRTLMSCRNGIFCHRDMRMIGKDGEGLDLPIHQIFVVVDTDGRHYIDSARPKWSNSVFPKVKTLAEFQQARISSKLDFVYEQLAAQTERSPGRYVLQ